MAKYFLDTSLFVYMLDRREGNKQAKAHALVRSCVQDGSGVISTQVLQEFANVAIVKLRHPAEAVLEEMEILESFKIVQLTPQLIRQGISHYREKQIHFWDATILAAAESIGCEVLYSENFSAGTIFGKLMVENPLL